MKRKDDKEFKELRRKMRYFAWMFSRLSPIRQYIALFLLKLILGIVRLLKWVYGERDA